MNKISRGPKQQGKSLKDRDRAELSRVLEKVDVTHSASKHVAAIKSSPKFLKTSLGNAGNINLRSESGYEGDHSCQEIRAMARIAA